MSDIVNPLAAIGRKTRVIQGRRRVKEAIMNTTGDYEEQVLIAINILGEIIASGPHRDTPQVMIDKLIPALPLYVEAFKVGELKTD